MKKILIILVAIIAIATTSCTENQRTRSLGGNMTIELPKGQKVTMATWKDADLFYMLEPMEDDYVPKTKTFVENSNWGVLECSITFVESR